jgi:hypothetical protein
VRAFRLLDVLEDTAGHVRHLDSPMVGRVKELEMLERALDRVVTERTSHLFTLLGPAGVGKSRLVREFVSGHASSATVLGGRCLSYGEGITFFPLAEIVKEAAGIERADDVATGRFKLAALAEGVEDQDRIVALVAGLLSWAELVTAEEAYWGARKLFEHLARQGPVCCWPTAGLMRRVWSSSRRQRCTNVRGLFRGPRAYVACSKGSGIRRHDA